MASIASVASEHQVLVEGCALVDRSERGKLALTGPDAKAFLNGQVTNEIEKLSPGEGVYAAFLTHKGKMLGDVRILDAGDEGVLLDTERVALQALFDMIRRYKVGFDVELHKRTLQRGLLSLIGPRVREVLDVPLPADAPEHAHAPAAVAGKAVRVVVTDVGLDVLCLAEDAAAVVAALTEAGAVPVPEDAAEVLRVERGRPRYGIELDDATIPQEAGLNDRAVSFTKGCYVGQETVARLFYKGKPNRHLRGLRLAGPASTGDELRVGEKVVGRLGTVVESERFGTIALALVRREAEPGATVAVGTPDAGTTATVVELPFS